MLLQTENELCRADNSLDDERKTRAKAEHTKQIPTKVGVDANLPS